MSSLEERIAALDAEIEKYKVKLDGATTPENEQLYGGLIKARTEMLTALLQQQSAASAAPVGK